MDEIKKGWPLAAFTIIFSLIFTMSFSWVTTRGSEARNSASVEYVNQEDEKIKKALDKHKENNIEQLDKKADKEDYIYLRGRLDEIYNIVSEKQSKN